MRFTLASTTVLLGQNVLASPRHAAANEGISSGVPPPPEPEPIEVTELPLPPVTPDNEEGSCSSEVNPHRTGCIGQTGEMQSGGFFADSKHVAAWVAFEGAPAAPDPASKYTGQQLIVVKTDGTTFPNGDPWKCITCGVPEENAVGRTEALDYPDPFTDGKKALAGTNIIDCGDHELISQDCTPDQVYIFPIRWNVTPDGSGPGGSIRELRLHPDNVHLGYSAATQTAGRFDQYGYFARLEFNESPTTGEPLAPRYDLTNVTMLLDLEGKAAIEVDGDRLQLNPDALTVGELRGFSKRGDEVTYLGNPVESCNIDVFAAHLTTGKVRRLTSHPEYVDPVDLSPDDEWTAVMDTRGTDRQMFMAGMRGVPPLTDLITTSAVSSVRNNGQRRFFQLFLIDRYGDRGKYNGQKANDAGDGVPGSGSINDPEWNGRADPKWSPDGTRIVYWQALTVPPACGGDNPLPCYPSTAPGGRTYRMMMAHLTSREPLDLEPVKPVPDTVPWGIPHEPGADNPVRASLPGGTYTLEGKEHGFAKVTVTENEEKTGVTAIEVTYHDFSDYDGDVINGHENVTGTNPSPSLSDIDWYSDLIQTSKGGGDATKKTSPDGFHLSIDTFTNIFKANGTLTTTVGDKVYKQPANGT